MQVCWLSPISDTRPPPQLIRSVKDDAVSSDGSASASSIYARLGDVSISSGSSTPRKRQSQADAGIYGALRRREWGSWVFCEKKVKEKVITVILHWTESSHEAGVAQLVASKRPERKFNRTESMPT